MYSEGTYFENPNRHSEDSDYKVGAIKNALFPFLKERQIKINSYADVGCGSGLIVKKLSEAFEKEFNNLEKIKGFDVSPHVNSIKDGKILFENQDFTKTSEHYDLVTLNDVFEHVPNTIAFLKAIGERANYVVMHVPLEDCFLVNFRSLQKNKLVSPGHLMFLNVNSALNLITYSGLKIEYFSYSKTLLNAPSNNKTILQKLSKPVKWMVMHINPYLYSKIFGASIIVIAKGIEVADEK